MSRLCLSAALLFLLVILVDSTPVNIHRIQDEGLKTSHRLGREKRCPKVLSGMLKSIKNSVKQGANFVKEEAHLIKKMVKATNQGNKGQYTVFKEKQKDTPVEEFPTLHTQNLLHEKNKGAKIVNEVSNLINKVFKATNQGNKGQHIVSKEKQKDTPVEEFPTLHTQNLLHEKNKDSRPAFCLEPKVVGHGKGLMPRYFYNAQTSYCEPFTYGGLGGNKNNFLTEEDCMKTCSK